jgi:chaperonin GroEL (HSP60 family)
MFSRAVNAMLDKTWGAPTVLAEAILREELRNVTAGANPMALRRGIDKAVTEDLGRTLESLELSELGQAKRIVVDKDTTTFIEGGGSSADIRARVQLIKRTIEETTSTYDREKLEDRLAKLAGGVAVIHVGAATEIEMKGKKARVDDALHAIRAAVEEGIVPGGGVALLQCQSKTSKLAGKLPEDAATGAKIVSRALEEPLRQIAINAGEEGAMVIEAVKSGNDGYGFNAETGQYEDLMNADIIDPTKVAHAALQNAASVAGLLLTTEVLVAELPEKRQGGGNRNYPLPKTSSLRQDASGSAWILTTQPDATALPCLPLAVAPGVPCAMPWPESARSERTKGTRATKTTETGSIRCSYRNQHKGTDLLTECRCHDWLGPGIIVGPFGPFGSLVLPYLRIVALALPIATRPLVDL